MRAVCLLRGVNVGGVRFAMRDLAAALEADGFADVRTVLASGNVLLTADEVEPDAVSAAVSAVIARRFGFDVGVITAGLPVVRAAVDGYPFARSEDRHAYVVLADRSEALDALLLEPVDPAVEQVRAGDGVLHWDCPRGASLTTGFARRLAARQRAGTVTTRNLRTLEKVLAAG